MPRRRCTPEQRENILKVRKKQKRACARGNHWWYPDYGWEGKRRPIEPQFWTIEERFPMPNWDGKSIICTACNHRGQIDELPPKKQQKMQDIIDVFIENTKSMRKSYAKTG